MVEQNQRADGSVVVPEVLRKYLGGIEIIEKEIDMQTPWRSAKLDLRSANFTWRMSDLPSTHSTKEEHDVSKEYPV